MLKKIFFLVSISFVFFPSVSLFCAEKIALVDMRRVWREYQGMKDVIEQVKKETLKRQKIIDKERDVLAKLKQDFQKKEVVFSESEKVKKNKEIQQKMLRFKEHLMNVNKELQILDSKLKSKVVDEVKKVVLTCGKQKKFQMILNKNEAFVLYSKKGMDITDLIIEKLSQSYGS